MIVVSYGEGNIDGVAGEKRRALQAFGHVPAQGIESDFSSQFPVLGSQLSGACVAFGHGCSLFFATNGGAVGMAAWIRQDSRCGEFF